MMSPTFSPDKSALMPKEISAIREEISIIDLHRTVHMEGLKVRELDKQCKYCQPYVKDESAPAQNHQVTGRVPLTTVNDLERTVEVAGKKGQITVPRSWVGKKVRVSLV